MEPSPLPPPPSLFPPPELLKESDFLLGVFFPTPPPPPPPVTPNVWAGITDAPPYTCANPRQNQVYRNPWRPDIVCPVQIAEKLNWEKLFREFGEDYAYGAAFDKRRFVEEGNPRYRPQVFMESSKMAVQSYNRTHLGSEIELVEPVGGKIIRSGHTGWEHFNFRAKSKNPDAAADQSVRLFFGERYLGKRLVDSNGVPYEGCVVGEREITKCTELEDLLHNSTHINRIGAAHLVTCCAHGCHPLDNIIHPLDNFLRNPSSSMVFSDNLDYEPRARGTKRCR
ncbi:hypothetical protein Tsubulata_004975 [Turnera subulata]|uniref:DUF3615 domain-containing protein n=1 Tax=Turnera subulata TaxID=218843 RepID=A0A9Q0J5R1_9ROSI|nr:hypothetical protein Tsubulata_004975 [Turnera subulata]